MTTEEQQEIEEIKLALLEHYTEFDSQKRLINAPKNDDELDEFIQVALNIKIPRKKVDKHHRPPFEFLSDLFFERVKNALGFANRNGGKTKCVAVLNFLDMFFKRNCEVASAGAVLAQASKCYAYFCEFLELPWFVAFCEKWKDTFDEYFVPKSLQSYTWFANNSSIEIITATEKGLRSPHPHKARLDEIDIMPWSLIQTGLSMARSTDEIRGQNVFTSTRQYQHGTMQRLLDTAAEKGIEIYEWNIWEVIETCTRRCVNDPKYGNCPIYIFCKGKAHYCDGYYKIDDFIDKSRVLDRETWDVEWLNKKPARNTLVYSGFDNTKHVIGPKRLKELCGYSEVQRDWRRVCGLDFGSSPGHPFVYLKFARMPNGKWLQFYEYVAEQRLMSDHAREIKNSPLYLGSEDIWSDWAAQERLELRSLGIRTKEAVKSVEMGIDHLRELLAGYPPREEPALYVWHECVHTIEEFGCYSYPRDIDGKVNRTGLPVKENDHCMDAARYALYSHKMKGSSGPKYTSRKMEGI